MTKKECEENSRQNHERVLDELSEVKIEGLPTPRIWSEDEWDQLTRDVAAAARERGDERPTPAEPQLAESQTPADIRDPLAHIREMLVKDYPHAATLSDEDLMTLYDRWEEERDAD